VPAPQVTLHVTSFGTAHGVSHAHAAGQRSEAFMLDLSQYSGLRLSRASKSLILKVAGLSLVEPAVQATGELATRHVK
jgi:hypothetical protein